MISVVIPAYNEERMIAACLTSLMHQRGCLPFEVIVVDNGSTDDTYAIARSFEEHMPLLRVLREWRKRRGRARRTGWAAARGDIILSTDADVVVPDDWVATMIAPFARREVVATTGPCRIDDCSPLTNVLYNVIINAWRRLYQFIMHDPYLRGANFAMRWTVYELAGGFDASADAHEDIDLGARAQQFGEFVFLPRAVVTASGRRFRSGFLRGMAVYPKTFIERFLLRRNSTPLLDVR